MKIIKWKYHSAVTDCEKKMDAKWLEGSDHLNLPEQEPVMIAEADEQQKV